MRDEGAVLITGGAGFIGSNLADALLSQGRRVVVYDNVSRPGTELNLKWLIERHPDRLGVDLGDVRDGDRLKRAMRRADTVFHLAAQVAVTSSLEDPTYDHEVNVGGTLNVLEAARSMERPPVVVFTSTNKVYGGLEGVEIEEGEQSYAFADGRDGIDEDCPLDFHSPYGCSKGSADQYVRDYARIYDLPTCVFRMSCIYGPRQFGTEDQGWVAHFLLSALRDEPITLYGDGKQVRDVLYVGDLVRAFQAAAEAARRDPGLVFNVGGGSQNAVSLLEVLEMIEEMTGREVRYRFSDWRPGDQRVYVTCLDRIHSALQWTPEVDVRDGLDRLTQWARSQPDLLERLDGVRMPQAATA